MEEKNIIIHHYIPVPEIFQSVETGRMFSACIQCNKALLNEGTQYVIQKIKKGEETITEYALCLECYQALEKSYSKQSMENIWNFILDSVSFDERNQKLWSKNPENVEAWLRACLTCGKLRDICSVYGIFAYCDGEDMFFHNLPYMFCDECMITLNELMSEKTKEQWDRWKEENLDDPPLIAKDIPDESFVLV